MPAPSVSAATPSRSRGVRGRGGRPAVVPQQRMRRMSFAMWMVAALFVLLVAAAGLQIRLISGQGDLDRLEQRIEDAQVRQFNLRQQEAMLRSPAQISQIAANDLGMVHAAPPVMVAAPPRVLGTAEPQVTTTPDDAP
ncbi:MAG: hypothetical protein IT195_04325 [Microthrixaceae bacterium]|nr:hypothetical protein [Microthrixaceae bacterium]